MMVIKRNKKIENSLLLLTAIVLSSCSQLRVYTPTSRFLTSETTGKLFSGTGSIGAESIVQSEISLENNEKDNPLKLSHNKNAFTSSFEMGLLERLDLYIKPSLTTPVLTGFKFQFYGQSRKEAKKGNTSVALTMASANSSEEVDDSSGIFFDDIRGYSMGHNISDISIILGHRFKEDTLTYVSINKSMNTVNIDIKSNTPLDGEKITMTNNVTGLNIGVVRYWEKYFLNLEGSVQENQWSKNSEKTTYANLNFNLGWTWN